MDDRLIELEIRYAHQERLLADLSSVLYEQRRIIDALEVRVQDLERRLREAEEPMPNEAPPHY